MTFRSRSALAGCAVFLLKAAVALQLDKHPLLQPETGLDTTAYVELAKRVIAGDVALGPGLYYVSPLYIYFLALAYGATKSFAAVRLLQALLGTAAVALIFLTAREWFGRRAAWIAGALAALTGIFTWYEALILQSSLDVFLTALALWLLARRSMFLAGLVFGLAALNRPNMLAAAVVVGLVLLAMRRFRAGALVLAGVIAGIAPVTIRNVGVAHQWSLVSSHGGINFYIGNGEGATGYFHAVAGMRSTVQGLAVDARRVAENALRRKLTDGEVSSYYTGLAWSWIREHPAWWLGLLLRKTYGVINAAHVSAPFSYTFYAYDAGTLLRVCIVGPWLLVPFGLFGLVQRRPWSGEYVAWLAFVPAYAASVVIFFVTERYKLPMYVPLAIGAGAGVDALLRHFTARRAAVLALLFVAVNWPLHLGDGRAEERLRMAEFHAARGDEAEAGRWAALALEKSTDARAEYLLGRALLSGGRASEAVSHLQRGINAAPLAGYDLAVALQQTGDLAAAARALRAVTPPPDAGVDVWLQLGKRAGEINAPDVAEPFFRRAVSMAPQLARAHYLLALDLLVLKRYAEAADEFAATVRLDPRNADALATLAWCEQRLGRLREAREHAASALLLEPQHTVARQVEATLRR
jgi:tetratricopeptide (TPR) repeat protein